MTIPNLHRYVWTAIAALAVLATGIPINADEPLAERRGTRRIIYNDDGGKMKHIKDASVESYLESYLASRLEHVAKTPVDTVFFCGHDDWAAAFYKSNVDEVELSGSPALRQLLDEGADPMQATIDFCRRNNMEIFYSFRMNDVHDSFSGELGPFKANHPEYLLGSKERNFQGKAETWTMTQANWSSLNYELAPVRNHIMRSIEEVMDRWDWDGCEFDYGRNASLFPAMFNGQSATDENRAILTEFQRRLRDKGNSIAKKRGKPFPLAVVVPETVELARYVGIDIETWLKDDLIDIVIAGNGYVPFSPKSYEMASLARKYGVPVYFRINANTGDPDDPPFHKYIESWRACATNAYASGFDGMCLFNTYDFSAYNEDQALDIASETKDAKDLTYRDKLYLADLHLEHRSYGGGDVAFYAPLENLVPMPLAESDRRVEFMCLEDLQGAVDAGKHPQITLRLNVEGLADGETCSFVFNDSVLENPSIERIAKGATVYEYVLTPEQVKQGTNAIRASAPPTDAQASTAKLTGVKLWIRYPEKSEPAQGASR